MTPGREPGRAPDRLEEVRRGGLAVRAGDADERERGAGVAREPRRDGASTRRGLARAARPRRHAVGASTASSATIATAPRAIASRDVAAAVGRACRAARRTRRPGATRRESTGDAAYLDVAERRRRPVTAAQVTSSMREPGASGRCRTVRSGRSSSARRRSSQSGAPGGGACACTQPVPRHRDRPPALLGARERLAQRQAEKARHAVRGERASGGGTRPARRVRRSPRGRCGLARGRRAGALPGARAPACARRRGRRALGTTPHAPAARAAAISREDRRRHDAAVRRGPRLVDHRRGSPRAARRRARSPRTTRCVSRSSRRFVGSTFCAVPVLPCDGELLEPRPRCRCRPSPRRRGGASSSPCAPSSRAHAPGARPAARGRWSTLPSGAVDRGARRTAASGRPPFAIAPNAAAICTGVTAMPWPKLCVARSMRAHDSTARRMPGDSPGSSMPVRWPKPNCAEQLRGSARGRAARRPCRRRCCSSTGSTSANDSQPCGCESLIVQLADAKRPFSQKMHAPSAARRPARSPLAASIALNVEPGS